MRKLIIRSEEWKQKQRLSHLGKTSGFKGKKMTQEQKDKISKAKKGKKWTKEAREKLSLIRTGKSTSLKGKKLPHRSGDKCNFWKGGITPINFKIKNSSEYKLWRKSVFERDNYQCIWGGKEHGNKLQADHIKSFSQFPELRFAIDNGRTLCVDCHRTTDNYGIKIFNSKKKI
jgi:ribosomal protein L32